MEPQTFDGDCDCESNFSSFANLEIDDGAGQLSLNPEAEISTGTMNIAWQQEFLKWGVKGEIKKSSQGEHEGIPACLVIFDFGLSLDFATGIGRVAEAKINLKAEPLATDDVPKAGTEEKTSSAIAVKDDAETSFLSRVWQSLGLGGSTKRPQDKDKPTSHYPHVAAICPKYLSGHPSTAQISNAIGAGAGHEFANLYVERSVSREQHYMIKVRGQRWLDQKTGLASIARWVVTENSSQGTGVPSDFHCGVLYQHNGQPFQLTVDVKLRTKNGLLFFWPAVDAAEACGYTSEHEVREIVACG